jgi:exosome complex component RRP43
MSEFVLDAETFKKLQPSEYYRKFISNSTRPDGRRVDEARQVDVQLNPLKNCFGSATAKIGSTIVTCGIIAEIAEPLPTVPNEGFIVPNFDLPALCCSRFRPGPPNQQTQQISQQIHDLFLKYLNFD